jgi:hypothetical protein
MATETERKKTFPQSCSSYTRKFMKMNPSEGEKCALIGYKNQTQKESKREKKRKKKFMRTKTKIKNQNVKCKMEDDKSKYTYY